MIHEKKPVFTHGFITYFSLDIKSIDVNRMNRRGNRCIRYYRCVKSRGNVTGIIYKVFLKKFLHKCQEEMQEKMKVALQKDKSLVQVQQQYIYVYICIVFIFA